jgi:hypothetical protein
LRLGDQLSGTTANFPLKLHSVSDLSSCIYLRHIKESIKTHSPVLLPPAQLLRNLVWISAYTYSLPSSLGKQTFPLPVCQIKTIPTPFFGKKTCLNSTVKNNLGERQGLPNTRSYSHTALADSIFNLHPTQRIQRLEPRRWWSRWPLATMTG